MRSRSTAGTEGVPFTPTLQRNQLGMGVLASRARKKALLIASGMKGFRPKSKGALLKKFRVDEEGKSCHAGLAAPYRFWLGEEAWIQRRKIEKTGHVETRGCIP